MALLTLDHHQFNIEKGSEKLCITIADLLYSQKDYINALKVFEIAKHYGGNVDFSIAKCLYKQFMFQESLDILNSLNIDNKNDEIMAWIFRCYYRMKHYKEAIEIGQCLGLEKLIKLKLHEVFAAAYIHLKNFDEAERILCSTKPITALYSSLYGSISYSRGDYHNAVIHYSANSPLDYKRDDSLRYADGLAKCDKDIPLELFYDFAFKDNNKDTITITFHPMPNKFLFYKSEFKTDVLFIGQRNLSSYYIINPMAILQKLTTILERKKYKKLYIVGSSKGGFAALLYTFLLSNHIKYPVEGTIFSPQTNISDTNIYLNDLPSIRTLRKVAGKYSFIKTFLNEFGDLGKYACQADNIKLTCIVGELSDLDMNEVNYLKQFVTIKKIEGYPFHGTYGVLYHKENELLKTYKILTTPTSQDDIFFKSKSIDFEDFLAINRKYSDIRGQWLPMLNI